MRSELRHFPLSPRLPSLVSLLILASFMTPNRTNSQIISTGWQLQVAAKTSDAGQAISRLDYLSNGWRPAMVPGTVLTSLVADGVYPDPLFGENNRPDKIPDSLCRNSYWYRTTFTVPPSYGGRRVWLNFDGINYIAEVWVNGKQIGTIRGAFARGVFDVTDLVTPGESAALAVLIQPPPNPGNHAEKTQKTGTGPNGGILAKDGPTFLCSIGWDWIPTIRDRNIGIWQNVRLSSTGPVRIEDPFVTSDLPLPRMDSAEISVQTTLRNVSDSPQSGTLIGSVEDERFQIPVNLASGESRLVTIPTIHLKNPRLWWPNGYGPANLYQLHLRFDDSDARDVTFGIRKITYSVAGSRNLTLSVNGVPVFCKGGNWGMDEAMKRIPRDRLEAQIRMHQLANYTMIRNWVGQSTSEDFYDLCDKYGILVWDEFFQPNPSDGPNPADTQLYLANVREKVLRFRNHPCIALWCGRNEGDPPPSINKGNQKIMDELDAERLYQPSSTRGRGVISHGPYCWRTPREYYEFSDKEAFKTEIGTVSIPTLEAVHAMMPEKDWEDFNDDWAEHDLCSGAQQGRGRDPYPTVIARRYGHLANLADFVRKSQLANYESFRAMYEGRFAKLFKPCTAVITWMSNPAQPSFVWQLYSHDLEPNSSLFAVRKACEPVHIQMNQSDFHVMIINNTPNQLANMEARIRVFNLDGSQKFDRRISVNASASAATDAGAIDFPADVSPIHFVKLELRGSSGNLVSDNFYWRASPSHENDLSALDSIAPALLDIETSRHDDGEKCLLDVKVTNSSSAIALMAHLQLRRKTSNERILPVYYTDNYVSLLPGESRTIQIEAAISDLHGEEPLVLLDGWNVTTTAKDSVQQNTDALPSSWPARGFGVVSSGHGGA